MRWRADWKRRWRRHHQRGAGSFIFTSIVIMRETRLGMALAMLVPATMRLLGRWNCWLPGRKLPVEQPVEQPAKQLAEQPVELSSLPYKHEPGVRFVVPGSCCAFAAPGAA
jgi:hypothetical protein